MAQKMNARKAGLATAVVFTFWHIVFLLIVAFGYGQSTIDSMLRMHFLTAPLQITAFSITNAIIILVLAFISAYITGWLFAKTWNYVK